jgi:hypothetical protein
LWYIIQMDNVLEIEVVLNMLNTVFAKAVFFNDVSVISKLNTMRHNIYYGEFNYESYLSLLKETDKYLQKYD